MPYIATWQNTSVMKGVIYRGGRLDVDQSVSSEAEWQFPDRDTAIRRRYVYGGTFGGLIVTNLIVLSIATNLSPEQDFSKTFQNNDPVMSMREGAQEMRHGLWAPEESDFHRLLQIMRLGVAGEHDVHPPGQGDPGAL